ncbi:MAG: type II secretion system F family protein [Candidatus Micrarchaeota archaeon]
MFSRPDEACKKDENMITIFSRPYRMLAYKICRRMGIAEVMRSRFKSVGPTLKQADLMMTLEEYISTGVFTAMITAPFLFVLLNILLTSLFGSAALGMAVSIISTVSYVAGIIVLFFIYPSYRLDNIKRDINMNLPYATTHMSTIAGTGVPVFLVFRIVGDFEEYGYVSKECRKIARNIELFGYDTITALTEVAAATPSAGFKDLLWGMISIIRTGGDLRQYLMEKSRIYLENQERLESEYIDNLELMAELYTTIFVAGPVLFVVMATIMGSMGSLPLSLDMLFSLMIYMVLPVASIGFIIMIESSKPVGS